MRQQECLPTLPIRSDLMIVEVDRHRRMRMDYSQQVDSILAMRGDNLRRVPSEITVIKKIRSR
jgi:hypothetical protein